MSTSLAASILHPRQTSAQLGTRDWAVLIALLALATVLRLAFFNGAFGSDDLIYLGRSVQIAQGNWASANYNGALRYGFNIPAGFFIYLFGINIIAANLWPLLCSIAEIAAVYVLAFHLWGRRPALCGALILAFMPLHVASATRIHADPVVAFFLTLSFVLFHFSEHERSRLLYFFAGIAMGLVFWAKELAVVTLFAFVFYPALWHRIDARWTYVVGGGLVMLLAHFALMTFVAGDPLHAIKTVTRQVSSSFIEGGDVAEDGIWYYFRYLFLDIKHVWLTGFIATASVLFTFHKRLRSRPVAPGTGYVIFWLLALIGILSFMPVSLQPLKFVMKQSNYLTLFLAPVALLSGFFIANIKKKPAIALLIATLGGGFLLAALEQQAYHVFTSNSKAALDFSKRNPGVSVIGSTNNANISVMFSILNRDQVHADPFLYISNMHRHADAMKPRPAAAAIPAFAIIDQETMNWGKNEVALMQAPPCWEALERLVPTGFGLGLSVATMLDRFIDLSPDTMRLRLKTSIDKISTPGPATVYRVNMADFWCERG
jgi:4-amino-4-deoxy-L-arabinose transferase-like glycosyltransferase